MTEVRQDDVRLQLEELSELAQRYDAAANYVRTGGRFGRREPAVREPGVGRGEQSSRFASAPAATGLPLNVPP